MNMWFYDGSMPEFALHNHEKLCFAGETPREAFAISWSLMANGVLPALGVALLAVWFFAGTHDEISSYADSGNVYQELYMHGRTAKIAAQKDFFGSEYTNQEGLYYMDYNGKNQGQDLKYVQGAKLAKTLAGESQSWWDRVNSEADKSARSMIASGKVGHHH